MRVSRDKVKRIMFAATLVVVLAAIILQAYYYFTHYEFGLSIRFHRAGDSAIVQSVEPGSPAERAGLRSGDRIIQVNGHIVSPADHRCRECFAREMRSGRLELGVDRGEGAISLVVQVERQELTTGYLVFLGVGVLYVTMGCWVFFARPTYPAAAAWGFFALCMGGFLSAYGNEVPTVEVIGVTLAIVTVAELIFAPSAALHFALLFPHAGPMVKRRWVAPLIYLIPTLILLTISLIMVFGYFFEEANPLGYLAQIVSVLLSGYLIIYLGLTIVVLVGTYLRSRVIAERRRMRAIIFGTAISFAALIVVYTLAMTLGMEHVIPDYTIALILALIPVTSFYAIVRHRAMDIELIFKSGLTYTLATGAVLALTGIAFVALFGFMLLLQDRLPYLGSQGGTFYRLMTDQNVQKFIVALWAVFIGASFGRVKERMQRFVDRAFYREKYDYRQALTRFSAMLEQNHDRARMLDLVIENIEAIVHPRSVAIVVRQPEGKGLVERAMPEALAHISLKHDSMEALATVLGEGRAFIGLRELNEETLDQGELIHAALVRLGADICLPLRVEGRILGMVMLGAKRSDTVYNLEEIGLLRLLADQTAISLDHFNLAQAAAEKERFKRELEIGRQMQQSLLPASMPDYKGLEIAAINVPAMEVGGDFYTFIEYSPKRLGIIAGDIVGKGVGGALNMAATLSTLTLIAEESSSVAEAMQRLNRYLVRNANHRSFAAVLFAIIETDKKLIRWCNGGLPEPILIAADGSSRFLESDSYTLPPGASPNSAYLEVKQTIEPGEMLVFVTDGVPEARPADHSDGEYGYDRLLAFCTAHAGLSPERFLSALSNEIHDYRRALTLEDDFTVVAVRFL